MWIRFTIWLVNLLFPSLYVKPLSEVDPEDCKCGHDRCWHTKGIGKCQYALKVSMTEKQTHTFYCSCQIFVKDGGWREPSNSPEAPTPEELETLYRR